ncbi:MAG: AraC family ligand binding domain-containing protein, partial [Verrucomicrobiota bacterium]
MSDVLNRPAFVSTQVTEARRYYLDLNPKRSAPIVVVCGGSERMLADYVIERKTFPYLCVEFVAEGAGTLELRGKRHPLRPGTAFAYAPGIAHLIRNDPRHPMRKLYVDFVGREAARLLAATPLGAWVPARIAAPQEVMEIFTALQRDAMAEEDLRPQLCAAQLRLLLLKIAQKALPCRAAEPRSLATYQRAR